MRGMCITTYVIISLLFVNLVHADESVCVDPSKECNQRDITPSNGDEVDQSYRVIQRLNQLERQLNAIEQHILFEESKTLQALERYTDNVPERVERVR